MKTYFMIQYIWDKNSYYSVLERTFVLGVLELTSTGTFFETKEQATKAMLDEGISKYGKVVKVTFDYEVEDV